MKKTLLTALAATALEIATLAIAAAETPPAHHVRGTLTKVTAQALTVQTPSGSVVIPIDKSTKVVGVVPASATEIVAGTFIGTANVNGAGSSAAHALEVVVFPPAMAGRGEGDYAWDLPAGHGHSTMTNGSVAGGRTGSMMTNATVAGVVNGATKTVTLHYKGGSKTVAIAPGVPIVRAVPASQTLFVAGAHVVAVPGAGAMPAPFVIVGEHGVTPPM